MRGPPFRIPLGYAVDEKIQLPGVRDSTKPNSAVVQVDRRRKQMSHLDAHIPQLIASESAFAAKTALMRSTIAQAEQAAVSAQTFHLGEAATAFQAAHARFVEAAAKVNALLDLAQANLGEAGATYVAQDAAAAATYGGF